MNPELNSKYLLGAYYIKDIVPGTVEVFKSEIKYSA